MSKIEVLVSCPPCGSIWLSNCEWVRDESGRLHVVGESLLDVGGWGSADHGLYQTFGFNFPATCVRKVHCVANGGLSE